MGAGPQSEKKVDMEHPLQIDLIPRYQFGLPDENENWSRGGMEINLENYLQKKNVFDLLFIYTMNYIIWILCIYAKQDILRSFVIDEFKWH